MKTAPPGRREALSRLGRLALTGALLSEAWPARAAPPALGDAVNWPAFDLIDGRRVEPADLQGRAVLVVFFSTTCPFCARQNVHLKKLVQQLGADAGLRLILVAQDSSVAPVKEYLARHAYPFEVTMAAKPLHEALSTRRVIPLTCVVDRQGRLREVIPGEMFEEDVLQLVRWSRT
jgi:peroxiredoxin